MRRRHVRPMDFTGKPLRGFVYVSAAGFRTAAASEIWLSRGERVAQEKGGGISEASPLPFAERVVSKEPEINKVINE